MYNIQCKNCKKDEYVVLDTEVCDNNPNNKTTIALCYSCDNLVEIIWDRRTLDIIKIENLGFLEK